MTPATLSTYLFHDTDFRGLVDFENADHLSDQAGHLASPDLAGRGSVIAMDRPSTEVVIDVFAVLNQPWLLGTFDNLLPSEVARTSELRLRWRPWKYVEYHDTAPGWHQDLDLLLRFSWDIHVTTPGWCLAVDGEIAYYLWPSIEPDGSVSASVDGWAFSVGYGSACREGVRDQLRQAVPDKDNIDAINGLIAFALSKFSGYAYDSVYLLPGEGERVGSGTYDTNEHVSVAALRKLSLVERFPWLTQVVEEGGA